MRAAISCTSRACVRASSIAHYNDQVIEEFERVRDFIVLHYCTSERTDTAYWSERRETKLPDTLAERMEIYKRTGRIFQKRHEMFVELSWFFVMHGMGLRPQSYDPLGATCNDRTGSWLGGAPGGLRLHVIFQEFPGGRGAGTQTPNSAGAFSSVLRKSRATQGWHLRCVPD